MTPLTFVLLSCTLSFGVPLALAIYELFTLSAAPRGGDGPPPEEWFPRAPRPLPDCLLPSRAPLRIRMLEDA